MSLGVFLFFLGDNNVVAKETEVSSYSREQVIIEVNKRRQASNLPDLILNEKLAKAAGSKALHMTEYSYFSHIHGETGMKWSDFIKRSDYAYLVAGENLANGFYTVPEMVDAWMESPTHRENILNERVDETGIGISYGELEGTPTIFVVQVFGKQE